MSTTIRETETPGLIPVEVEEAVKRGAELLDDRHPGWADKVQTDCLNLCSLNHCVLGQLYGGTPGLRGPYVAGLDALGVNWNESEERLLGFDLDHARPGEFSDLDRAWLAEIMERRSA